MTKKRLNQSHRYKLVKFAEENVKCEEEYFAAVAARNEASSYVREVFEAKYPPKDMELLLKYGVAHRDTCVKGANSEGTVVGFEFSSEEEAPLVPNCGSCKSRVLPFTDHVCELVFEAARKNADYKKAVGTKLQAYRSLIWDARYFEDVLEVWPAVEALRDQIGAPTTSLTRLSPQIAEFIRNDNAGAIAA
jgi:hypothetical protein